MNILDNGYEDHILVHGIALGTGGAAEGLRYGHCWLETPDGKYVIDKSNGNDIKMDKDFYYEHGSINAEDAKYYTRTEARKKLHETGHYGDWELDNDKLDV
jgi:hypothetical protein